MLTPVGRLKVALRAARRRRYGYAALRIFRGGLRAALARHLARSVGPWPYASQLDDLRALYARGVAELRRRFPSIDFSDPRSDPHS